MILDPSDIESKWKKQRIISEIGGSTKHVKNLTKSLRGCELPGECTDPGGELSRIIIASRDPENDMMNRAPATSFPASFPSPFHLFSFLLPPFLLSSTQTALKAPVVTAPLPEITHTRLLCGFGEMPCAEGIGIYVCPLAGRGPRSEATGWGHDTRGWGQSAKISLHHVREKSHGRSLTRYQSPKTRGNTIGTLANGPAFSKMRTCDQQQCERGVDGKTLQKSRKIGTFLNSNHLSVQNDLLGTGKCRVNV